MRWDADKAVLEQSRRLGWKVRVEVPLGEQYDLATRRPVDITVADRDGSPVTALEGRVLTLAPTREGEGGESALVELPHAPGRYRTLAPLTGPGLWDLTIDSARGDIRFIHRERIELAVGGEP